MEDPFAGWGLRAVTLADRPTFEAYFGTLAEPISDYTFAQFYTWRNSLRILWKEIHGNLCVFANGAGDLTMLAPPIGQGGADRALAEAYELMDAYNAAKGVVDRSRIEYVSAELLGRLSPTGLVVEPLGTDYVYDVRRMIDLAGGDLASKRQARNRFVRLYQYRVETYDRVKHLGQCLNLLGEWKQHQDVSHRADASTSATKRQKESLAAELTLDAAEQLGMRGMVVYVEEGGAERVRGFTFGEGLGRDQSSITVEKTDLSVKGLAQFIFSEFCAREWGGRPFVNVGDDWGLESLAWTKTSYRPVRLMKKFVVKRMAPAALTIPQMTPAEIPVPVTVRNAGDTDMVAAGDLEKRCFTAYSLSSRQLRYLRHKAIFLVAEQSGRVVGDGIALVRRNPAGGASGRIYSLAVDPACRGQGIGQRLLDRLLDELTSRGVRRVYLEVEESNAPALRLYERNGFRRAGELPDYYGEGKGGLHMVREVGATATARA